MKDEFEIIPTINDNEEIRFTLRIPLPESSTISVIYGITPRTLLEIHNKTKILLKVMNVTEEELD